MDTSDSALGRDDWLAHAHALRRLAAGLVRDANEAEDLVQETWVRAGGRTPSRSWLTTVLRNLVRDRARERGRRAWTERAVAREEGVPSGAEVLERLEVAQRVAREVAALDEQYRLVIHLRYFEDQGPEAIARRLAVPLGTVRTRLKRGLVQLRERMDRAHGGERRAWMLALAPLARGVDFLAAPPLSAASTGWSAGTSAAGLTTGMMMGTKLLLSATALLTAAGFFLWLRRPEPAREAPAPAQTMAERRELERAIGAAVAAAPAPAAREERATGAAPAAPEKSAAPAPRTLAGLVLVVDEHGAELARESGLLTLATGTSQADARLREVPFAEGRFSTEIGPDEWIVFAQLIARGRKAVLPEPSPIVPGDEPLVVRGQWLARGRLRVIDADSRRDLNELEVRCADGWRANPEWTHPGDDERVRTVLSHGTSPLELPERTWLTPYWVHAPGHAWARIDFDHKAGGERTLELETRRGGLVVAFEAPVPEGAFVRLYAISSGEPTPDAQGQLWMRPAPEELPSYMADVSVHAHRAGETRIDDLAPGRYHAAVETGEYEDRMVLGMGEVEVLADTLTQLVLPVDASLLDVPRTHLFGSIRVPEGLVLGDCTLYLKRVDGGEAEFVQSLAEMSYGHGDELTRRFDAGPRRTGTYFASISGIQHRELFEALREGGDSEMRIEIPELVSVEVELVEAATGLALEPERLQWADGEVPGATESTLMGILRDPRTRAFGFTAPRGPVRIRAEVPGYREGELALELVPPRVVARIELARATGIHLVLREGDATLPVGYEVLSQVVLRNEQGAREHAGLLVSDAELTLFLARPGRYTLEFPALDGFRKPEPRTVDVGPDELVELVVPVERP